ncbi:MAG: beta-galactosidase [Opitutaceae bacterium]|nr:beta-galactosidase [Opitutaceae bacterium]
MKVAHRALRLFPFSLAAGCILHAAGAPDSLRPWDTYHTIMWVGNSATKKPERLPRFYERLREMGINSVSVGAGANAEPVVAAGLSFYVENLVNRGLCLKFSSNVRDWDKFVTGWARNGRPESALVRDYCLDDPGWRMWAAKEVQTAVRRHQTHRPLAYNLRDELSTTISANPFDYDFSPAARAGFRTWLKSQYRDLAALNTQWETRFPSWDDVRPFTTDQIKSRMAGGGAVPTGAPDWAALRKLKFDPAAAVREPTRWNFAPWADFRTYMDRSLADALGELRRVARELDPATPVGIEGTQMPSAFGGYDLWRLAQVLDWVEPYDIGNAREILGSFMPGRPILTTVFEKETRPARRRLWHLLLEGDRGCVVWWSEDSIDWASDDYALTAKGRALAPVLHELQSPLAALFLRARRETDPIYLVYSQPSIQVDWLLESTSDGPSWYRRFSSHEARHNRLAQDRAAWMKLLQDAGYTPQFVAAEKLPELVAAAAGHDLVVVLSDALALADGETQAVAALARNGYRGHAVLTDGPTGVFDEHGRLRGAPGPLDGFGQTGAITVTRGGSAPAAVSRQIAAYGRERLRSETAPWFEWAETQLGLRRPVRVPSASHTRVYRYQLGGVRLVAFERNITYHMSEDLRQAGGNEALETPVGIAAELEGTAHVYDLRSGRYVGHTDRFSFTLDPWQPSLFAVSPRKIESADLVGWLAQQAQAPAR